MARNKYNGTHGNGYQPIIRKRPAPPPPPGPPCRTVKHGVDSIDIFVPVILLAVFALGVFVGVEIA